MSVTRAKHTTTLLPSVTRINVPSHSDTITMSEMNKKINMISSCVSFSGSGKCQNDQWGWSTEGHNIIKTVRRCHQEPVGWSGDSGMLLPEEGIPALRFSQIVSANRNCSDGAKYFHCFHLPVVCLMQSGLRVQCSFCLMPSTEGSKAKTRRLDARRRINHRESDWSRDRRDLSVLPEKSRVLPSEMSLCLAATWTTWTGLLPALTCQRSRTSWGSGCPPQGS